MLKFSVLSLTDCQKSLSVLRNFLSSYSRTIPMRLLTSVLTMALLVSTALAQTGSETRTLKAFKKVKAYGPVLVILHASDEERAVIKAVGMDAVDVKTEIKGGTLRIKLKGDLFEEKTVRVDLYYKNLDELLVAAGADVQSGKPLVAKDLELHASSGSIMELEFSSGTIDINVSEGAIAELLGGVEFMDSRVSTGGILKAFNLAADNVVVRAYTGGVAKVEATEDLEIHADLGGVVHYRGNPKNFSGNSTLGGIIRKN